MSARPIQTVNVSNPPGDFVMASEAIARISLEDIIAAAGQGAVRALDARKQASSSSNNGFFIDVHIRCGYPPVTLPAVVGTTPGEA